jgi:hypothetical protein
VPPPACRACPVGVGAVGAVSIEWDLYRKCPACAAPLGQPCYSMTGNTVLWAEKPHGVRKLRKLRGGR